MERLQDPCNDRVMKDIEPPPRLPLSSELLFPEHLDDKPDCELLLDFLSKEGKITKEDVMQLIE